MQDSIARMPTMIMLNMVSRTVMTDMPQNFIIP